MFTVTGFSTLLTLHFFQKSSFQEAMFARHMLFPAIVGNKKCRKSGIKKTVL